MILDIIMVIVNLRLWGNVPRRNALNWLWVVME